MTFARIMAGAVLSLLSVAARAQGPTVYRVSTFAGSLASPGGDVDALTLTLNVPIGLVRDSQGNLYVSDYGNHRIRKITPAGRSTVIAGTGTLGFTGNGGPATSAQISYPRAMALDGDKFLYFSEVITFRIRKIDLTTGVISLVMGDGVGRFNGDGNAGPSTSVSEVLGLAVDAQGNLLVGDSGNSRIRKLSATDGTVSTIAGNGTAGLSPDGTSATAALLNRPSAMAVHPNGDLYFSEVGNGLIRRLRNGVLTTMVGSASATGRTGPALQVKVAVCVGMALNTGSTGLYFTDEDSDTVRMLDFASQSVFIIAGTFSQGFSGDGGSPLQASLANPEHIVVEPNDIVVTDALNNRIRRIVTGKTITTIAGGSAVINGDGGPANQATVKGPIALRLDLAGNVFIGESGACSIRRVDVSGKISTVVGTAGQCLAPSILASAEDEQGNIYWVSPQGVFVRTSGDPPQGRNRSTLLFNDILVSRDQQRIYLLQLASGVARVYFSTPANLTGQGALNITPFAGGSAGSAGDGGPALANVLFIPEALAEDSAGNVYILDAGNENIRRVDRQKNTISTVVSSTPLALARDLTVDPANNLLVTVGPQIPRFNPQGVVDSVVGSGAAGLTPDGYDGYLAMLNSPAGIAAASDGTVYYSDSANNLVRKLTPVTAVSMDVVAGQPGSNGTIPAQVLVKASDGAVLGGLKVNFSVTSGNATLSAASAISDVNGIATVSVTLKGDSAVVTAAVTGLSSVDIQISASGSTGAAPRPAITSASSLGGWGQAADIAAGGWVQILGSNFGADPRVWAADDFNGDAAPTALSGVQVLMNGIPAYVEYVSSVQINCVAPDGIGAGDVVVVVKNGNGSSDGFKIHSDARVPGLLAPDNFKADSKQYVVGIYQDQTYMGPAGLVAGAPFRPAVAGDLFTMYGISFGATNPAAAAGHVTAHEPTLPNVEIRFGDVSAKVQYAGLVDGTVGLYQINVIVPTGVSGDVPLTILVDGVVASQQLWVATK